MIDKPRDPGEMDASLGYVSIHEINNMWTARMRQLDVELWPVRGRTPSRDELLEFVATMKLELLKRCATNYVEFCRRVPDPSLARKKTSLPPPDAASDAEYKERKSKLAKWY